MYKFSFSVTYFQRLRHLGEEVDDDMEDEFYLKRLDSGLFTLQLIDYIMLEICASGASSVSLLPVRWTGGRCSMSHFCVSHSLNLYSDEVSSNGPNKLSLNMF